MSLTEEAMEPQKPNPFDAAKADAQAKAILAQGGSQDDVDSYLHQTYGLTPAHGTAQSPAAKAGRLPAIQKAGDEALAGAIEDQQPTYATKALGGLASFGKDIPFVETAQATLASKLNKIPFDEALQDIRGAEASAPSAVRNFNRFAGSTIGALATPGSAVKSAATFGALGGAGNADNRSLGDVLTNTAVGAGAGAAAGKIGETVGNLGRAAFSKTAGGANKALKNTVSEADRIGFGAAEAEGHAAGGTSPKMQAKLTEPRYQPHADDIRQSFALQGKPGDDASVLLQLRNELSQQQSPIVQKISNASQGMPLTGRQSADIQAMKNELVQAGEEAMPSLPHAVENSKVLRGEHGAFKNTLKSSRAVAKGSPTGINNLGKTDDEALKDAIAKMTPGQASAGTKGTLAALKETKVLPSTINPFTAFGTGKAMVQANRLAPFLAQLDQASGAGNASSSLNGAHVAQILRALGLTGTEEVGRQLSPP